MIYIRTPFQYSQWFYILEQKDSSYQSIPHKVFPQAVPLAQADVVPHILDAFETRQWGVSVTSSLL